LRAPFCVSTTPSPDVTYLFAAVLIVWTCCSVLRFVHMYDQSSRFQAWRRWDLFRLVPRGAFFSPSPPGREQFLLVRDVLADGRVSEWTEVAYAAERHPLHAVWNPGRHQYRARLEASRELLLTAGAIASEDGRPPVTFLLSDRYIQLLRFTSTLPRNVSIVATQFSIIEVDILSRHVTRHFASALHSATSANSLSRDP
jgi:hypothetical protein